MRSIKVLLIAAGLVGLLPFHDSVGQGANPVSLYHLSKTVALGVPDRWDYVLYEPLSHRLYAAHGASIDILDGKSAERLGSVPVPGANGVALALDGGKGYAGSRVNQAMVVFDLKTLEIRKSVPVGEDTDAVVYDPMSKRLFVMEGDPHKAVAIDTISDTVAGAVSLAGQPEYAVVDGAGALFVNIVDKRVIQRVNTKTLMVEATWSIPECESPHGLSLDSDSKRLFATCVNAKLVVVDATTGRIVTTLPIGLGSDASAVDTVRRRVFSANGKTGTLTVIRVDGPDKYELLGENPTQPLARTMAVDSASGRIYMLGGDLIEVDPKATNPRKRYGVAPGSTRLLILDPVP